MNEIYCYNSRLDKWKIIDHSYKATTEEMIYDVDKETVSGHLELMKKVCENNLSFYDREIKSFEEFISNNNPSRWVIEYSEKNNRYELLDVNTLLGYDQNYGQLFCKLFASKMDAINYRYAELNDLKNKLSELKNIV